jgi:3-dehydroquinate synthase
MLGGGACSRILNLLELLGFELYAPELYHQTSEGGYILMEGLEEFREHLGGQLTITLLREIGVGVEVHAVDAALMLEALNELGARQMRGRAASGTA